MNKVEKWKKVDIYPVITPSFCDGRDPLYVLEKIMEGGAKAVQLRIKDGTDREYLDMALKFRKITDNFNALLIIDDRIDIALGAKADGVHLGQDDFPVDMALKIDENLIVGTSSHNLDEALKAQELGATYVNIGPVYSTKTKSLPMNPLGIEAVKTISPSLNIPFTVMGGIKLHHISDLIRAGAHQIAMVTAITRAKNISATVKEFIEEMRKYSNG